MPPAPLKKNTVAMSILLHVPLAGYGFIWDVRTQSRIAGLQGLPILNLTEDCQMSYDDRMILQQGKNSGEESGKSGENFWSLMLE